MRRVPTLPGWIPRCLLIGVALSVLSLRTIARPGYLIQVDIVFGPHPAPLTYDFSTPVQLLLRGLILVFGGSLAGKLFAAATIAWCAFAPMLLFRRASWYVQAAAGLFGALNPWVYDRLVEGQWGVAIAGSGLFAWLAAWESLVERPGRRSTLVLFLTSAILTFFDAHILGPILVLGAVAFLAHRPASRPLRHWAGVAAGLLAVVLLVGALAFFIGRGGQNYDAINRVGRVDFETFKAATEPGTGLLAGLLSMHGYWGEATGRFITPGGGSTWWPLTSAVILGLSLYGARLQPRWRYLLLTGAIGLGLSASTALPGGVDAATWLAARVPMVGVYREPGKWGSLWMLAIGCLSLAAITAVSRWDAAGHGSRTPIAPGGRNSTASLGPLLAAVASVAIVAPGGLVAIKEIGRVVTPVNYPAAWYGANRYLRAAVPVGVEIAVLPMHRYETLPFTGRLTSNPAEVFFDGRLLLPTNPELAPTTRAGSGTPDPRSASPGPYREGRPPPPTRGTPYREGDPPPPGSSLAPYRDTAPPTISGATPSPYAELPPPSLTLAAAPVPESCQLARFLSATGDHWAIVEEAPGGYEDAIQLEACRWRIVYGTLGGLVVLQD
jgi:hypothetical protein